MLRFGPVLLLGALVLSAGCEPKCREVVPLSEVQAGLRERVDDRLDEVDATDAQRAKIQAIFAATEPALAKLRKDVFPLQHAVVAELRRGQPDRARLFTLVDQQIRFGEGYLKTMLGAMFDAHAQLAPEQRKTLMKRFGQPSPPLQESFLMDRAVDYFLLRISANEEQRQLVERILKQLIKRGRALQREGASVRALVAFELAKDAPDRARIDAAFARGRLLTQQTFVELTGYYLLLQSKLDREQRAILDAELVRLEPCSVPGPS